MSAAAAPPVPLTQREIALFFFPMLLNVQMMSVSHSIINAGLARQGDFVVALAAFSVAMVLHLFLASPSYQNHTVTIAMVRGRRSLHGTILFVLAVAAWVSAMLALVAFTPAGEFVLGRLLGVGGEIAAQARATLRILVFLPFLTGFRGLFQGLVMQARHTALVSLATVVRVVALLGFLALGMRWFSGAVLGAFALLACIAVETVLMAYFAWRCRIRHEGGAGERSTAEIFRFALPLAYASCLQQTVPLLINAIIGRLPDGALALASFGVIRGFIFLLAGPMRNLQQACQTLVRDGADYRVLVRFFRRVGSGLAILTVVIAYPLSGPVLGTLMGLDADTRAYIALPLAGCALYCYLYGAVSLLRGWFTGEDRTTELGRSVVYKVLFLLACWGILLLFPLPAAVPGVALAVLLLMAAELCETAYLHQRRQRLLAA
jgi:O-antigen/teichoic acid export membrane protein